MVSKDQITKRELAILQLLANGLTNREIANVLGFRLKL